MQEWRIDDDAGSLHIALAIHSGILEHFVHGLYLDVLDDSIELRSSRKASQGHIISNA